ncbi:nucleopolyhedrovirus P10 family protein [Streptomyces sp. DSM 44917]|uniref:Nucleopolyhedrovirus P10 family protein n=1 Tax=Streptomyces boetiae TaxID=3075541 RepID=A0ABU2LFR6_9ACTN|nr:nucleopolyhedrovirus P10 family protein [Streptomyces sp. DSM 44917]MDT0310078.1 nucleopolyhedrovirus P10 family protein [Streptomyces sp. DSM 44917]
MGADPLLRAVRRQLGLGRLLPLGAPADGAWLAESAARPVLRRAVAAVPGARPEGLRLALADPEAAPGPVVPPPPSGLPPGPLRIEAGFAAGVERPFPECAAEVRAALAASAGERLGLVVAAIDLKVTGLLSGDGAGPTPDEDEGEEASGAAVAPDSGPAAVIAAAVLAAPGVRGLSGALGGRHRAVVVEEPEDAGQRPLIRLQLIADAEPRTLEVARNAARAAVEAAGPARVSVLITGIAG